MMVNEVVLATALTAGGLEVSAERPSLAFALWLLAGLAVFPMLITAVVEREAYPPALVARRLAVAVAIATWVGAMVVGVRWLAARSLPLAIGAGLAGLFGGPLLVVVLRGARERRR